MVNLDNYFIVATILKQMNFDGSLKIEFTDYFKKTVENDFVFLNFQGKAVPFRIKKLKLLSQNSAIIIFDDYQNSEKALKLVNKNIYMENKYLKENESNLSNLNLLNFAVINQNDKKIGKIIDFFENKFQTLLYVKSNDNKKIMIPLAKQLLINIDFDSKLIKLKMEEGITELN